MNSRALPLISVSGSHREMGRQLGEACRSQVTRSIENARQLLNESYDSLQLDWVGALIQARKYLPFAEERYPQYVDELRGMAEGANVSFGDLTVVNAMEAVTMDALHLVKCTSMAVNQERTTNGTVLAATTPSEAIRRTLIPQRAAGYNHLLVHESGEIFSVEVSARQFAILYAHEGVMAHTNHFLDDQMRRIESEPDELIATRVRYFRTMRLLNQTQQHSICTLQAIQKDHINYPDSICNHSIDGDPLDREKTVTALTMDLTNRRMCATWGNPCENMFTTYQLEN